MLAVALAAGAAAAWLSQRHIQARIEQLEDDARAPLVSVVVAATDLAAGARLTADAVAVREVPVAWASPSAVTPEQFDAIASTSLAHPLARGEALLRAHVAPPRPQGFADRLVDGRRAVTIPVDEISSVSGLLQPGDVIDLYVSFEHKGNPVTVPLLQGMKVLATGRQVEASPRTVGTAEAERSFSTVTLDASLDEAVKLIAARQAGAITAMLRRPGDAKPARAEYRGDLGKLLGLQEPQPEIAARKRARVPVIYGDRPLRSIPRLGGAATEESEETGAWVDTNANAAAHAALGYPAFRLPGEGVPPRVDAVPAGSPGAAIPEEHATSPEVSRASPPASGAASRVHPFPSLRR